MVLFYNTLIAMKRADIHTKPLGFDDIFFSPDEEFLEFSGEIHDPLTKSLHVLRIYNDRNSGGVRFEATPRKGRNVTTPIWTAFVREHLGDAAWMKKVGPCTVMFRELRPYVFCQGYSVPKAVGDKTGKGRGRYQITFTGSEGESHLFFHELEHEDEDGPRYRAVLIVTTDARNFMDIFLSLRKR